MIKYLFASINFKISIVIQKSFVFLRLMFLQAFFFLLFYVANSAAYYSSVESSDYRNRHPILMRKVEKNIDIPLLAGRGSIKTLESNTINGFLDQYKKDNASVLFLMIPSATVSSSSIKKAVKDIRKIIRSRGIPSSFISERLYDANYGLDIDTIRLAYFAIKPVVGSKCGFWPEDILGGATPNRNWSNYGCAYQNNLAAQVVNPLDLFYPRAMTPPDANKRDKSISDYRQSSSDD
ncbi:CpaD family pilus assembly protein [Candidatus Liberibacter brunswickensis]|uniref:CpaD family pilus assembly protein n=1 Tax=Candidatus Liberibacter brunswickensis TaxID=1968796 RepID=UPI002FE23201